MSSLFNQLEWIAAAHLGSRGETDDSEDTQNTEDLDDPREALCTSHLRYLAAVTYFDTLTHFHRLYLSVFPLTCPPLSPCVSSTSKLATEVMVMPKSTTFDIPSRRYAVLRNQRHTAKHI